MAGEDSVDVWGWDSNSPCLSDQAVAMVAAAAVSCIVKLHEKNTKVYLYKTERFRCVLADENLMDLSFSEISICLAWDGPGEHHV
jgi:hypothetical protein